MYIVYQSNNLAEAELLRHRLAEEGIRSTIRNGLLQGAMGELPANLKPEICVFESGLVEQAREVALSFDAELRAPDEGAEWFCSQCEELSPSNFELCWKCRAPRPDSAGNE